METRLSVSTNTGADKLLVWEVWSPSCGQNWRGWGQPVCTSLSSVVRGQPSAPLCPHRGQRKFEDPDVRGTHAPLCQSSWRGKVWTYKTDLLPPADAWRLGDTSPFQRAYVGWTVMGTKLNLEKLGPLFSFLNYLTCPQGWCPQLPGLPWLLNSST